MFKLKRVFAENAIVFKSVEYEIKGNGVVVVRGLNLTEAQTASNGAGKSALFELVPIVLFGKPARQSSRTSIQLDPKKKTTIGVEFSLGEDSYTVIITRNPNGGKILKNGEDITPKGGLPALYNFLKDLLYPITEDSYYSYIHVTPSRASILIDGSPAIRHRYLADILGLDILDRIAEEIRSDLTELQSSGVLSPDALKQRIKEVEAELKKLPKVSDEKLQHIRGRMSQIYGRGASIYAKYKKAKEILERNLIREYEKLKGSTQRHKLIFDRMMKLYNYISGIGARKQYEEQFRKLKEEYKHLVEKDLQTLEDIEEEEQRTKEVGVLCEKVLKFANEVFLQGLDSFLIMEILILRRRFIAKYFSELESYEDGDEALYEELFERHTKLMTLIKTARESIRRKVCLLCGKEVDKEDLQKRLEKLMFAHYHIELSLFPLEKRVRYKEKYSRFFNLIKSIVDTCESASKEAVDKVIELMQYGGLPAVEDYYKKLLKKLEALRVLKMPLLAMKSLPKGSCPKLVEEAYERLKKNEQKAHRLYERELELQQKLSELGWSGETSVQLRKHVLLGKALLPKLKSLYKSLEEKYNRLLEVKTKREQLLKTLNSLKEELKKSKEIFERSQVLSALLKVFSHRGLKRRVLLNYLNEFKDNLNHFVSHLFRSMQLDVKLDKSGLHFLYRYKDKSGDIRELSSGQKRRLSLAMVLALASIVPPKMRTNFLILDEIDANVDSVGVSKIEEFLPLLKQWFEVVFVITPRNDATFSSCADEEWVVVRNSEGSRLQT